MSFGRYGGKAQVEVERSWVLKTWEDLISGYEDFNVTPKMLIDFLKVDPFEAFHKDPHTILILKHFVYAYEFDLCDSCARCSYGVYLVFLSTL